MLQVAKGSTLVRIHNFAHNKQVDNEAKPGRVMFSDEIQGFGSEKTSCGIVVLAVHLLHILSGLKACLLWVH